MTKAGIFFIAFGLSVGVVLSASQPGAAEASAAFAAIDRTFEEYQLDQHVPGLVYGVVMGGRLVYVKGAGVQDLDARRPVTPETLFRIASMTKSLTAL